jgi:hypothetical protein
MEVDEQAGNLFVVVLELAECFPVSGVSPGGEEFELVALLKRVPQWLFEIHDQPI